MITSMQDQDVAFYVRNAEHFKAIGHTEVSLWKTEPPWNLTDSCEPGGSHRLDIATSVWFRAKHPCGLTFRWSFDIEDSDANGSSRYQIQTKRIRDVLALMPDKAAKQFRRYLAECAKKVREKGDEFAKYAERQHADADTLLRLAHDPIVETAAT